VDFPPALPSRGGIKEESRKPIPSPLTSPFFFSFLHARPMQMRTRRRYGFKRSFSPGQGAKQENWKKQDDLQLPPPLPKTSHPPPPLTAIMKEREVVNPNFPVFSGRSAGQIV